jgi:hypothetical protein
VACLNASISLINLKHLRDDCNNVNKAAKRIIVFLLKFQMVSVVSSMGTCIACQKMAVLRNNVTRKGFFS